MTDEQFTELIKMLEKSHYRSARTMWNPYSTEGLPDPAKVTCPTVTLPKEQLARFHDRFKELLAFTAVVLDCNVKEVCLLRMIMWLRGHREPT